MYRKKRGQVAIFVILGIVIIGLAVAVYFLFPGIQSTLGFGIQNPEQFIQTCLEDKISETVETLSLQGGSLEPSGSFFYQGNEVEYLCYTNKNYVPCVVQQPLLKSSIETEIEEEIEEEAENCFFNMEETFGNRGYQVNLERGNMDVELLPKRIAVSFNYKLALDKGEEFQRYERFDVVLNNNLYELISIANSIVQWEAEYGGAETTVYMDYYPDLKVEKKEQGDGTTIYIITDRNTENKFQFASRSVVWPAGFGLDGI